VSADLGPFVEAADGPMVVVTVSVGDDRAGCLVGFHTQCSIEPARYAVFISKANHSHSVARRARVLGVNLVGRRQTHLAELFGGRSADEGIDKFAHCVWWGHRLGVPILAGSRAWIVGQVVDQLDAGDHVGFVLDPVDVETAGSERPLRYEAVDNLEPGHAAGGTGRRVRRSLWWIPS
jgi:flavin reductase (DIM6/NTAB) family NADH-FMN oxidoreductase RutF